MYKILYTKNIKRNNQTLAKVSYLKRFVTLKTLHKLRIDYVLTASISRYSALNHRYINLSCEAVPSCYHMKTGASNSL